MLFTSTGIAAYCYETVILHYPDRDWRLISYERKPEEEEVIAKFVPQYDDNIYWNEMLIFHSNKAAKKANETADSFIQTRISEAQAKFGAFKPNTVKTDKDDSVVTWCSEKGSKGPNPEPAQCEILRVTKGIESVITIRYIDRNLKDFEERTKIWLPILENAVVYYSYYRWNRMMNKAICVEL